MRRGLALPHIASRAVRRFVGAIGVAPSGIDFRSMDGELTQLVLLVLSPFEQRNRLWQIATHLAGLSFDNRLRGAVRPQGVLRILGLAAREEMKTWRIPESHSFHRDIQAESRGHPGL